ncbi:MAG: hypothetical protein JSS77_12885 [Acidobacteria bacterium]|nr:hypothetical protein [Acidobacteriota bacterium]
MTHEMYIVKTDGKYHGPFREYEASAFASQHQGDVEVLPLWLPSAPDAAQGFETLKVLEAEGYRAYVDSFKADTHLVLAGTTQEFYFARRQGRVLTSRELDSVWEALYKVSRSVESLMHYAEVVIADPRPENLHALRKAFWRNRNSDDVDPHYEDRSW